MTRLERGLFFGLVLARMQRLNCFLHPGRRAGGALIHQTEQLSIAAKPARQKETKFDVYQFLAVDFPGLRVASSQLFHYHADRVLLEPPVFPHFKAKLKHRFEVPFVERHLPVRTQLTHFGQERFKKPRGDVSPSA